MSVHVSSAVWHWPSRDPISKLVLLKLADNANDEGLCWPSLQRIVRETGLSNTTVCDRLKKLEAIGIITRKPGGTKPGERGGKTTRYQFHLEKLYAVRTTPPHAEGGRASGEEGGSPQHEHKPSKENHQKEPSLATATPSRGRRLDLAFEMLVKIQGSNLAELSKSERGKVNAALKSIREAMPSSTDENLATDIKRRARRYKEEMPNAVLTANALAAHWSRLSGNKEGDSLESLPEPAWDWEFTLYRMGEWHPHAGKPWRSLTPTFQNRIFEARRTLHPIGYEFAMDELLGVGWETWENRPWPEDYRDAIRDFLDGWVPDGWREVWPDCFSAACPAEWSDVRESERYEVLRELRARIKK